MSRIVVTGASGFIGRAAVKRLVESAHEVHAVARCIPEDRLGATWHVVDLLEVGPSAAMLDAVRGDRLLHLAWYAQPIDRWTSPENVLWVESSLRLTREFVASGGTRVVGAGSCAEYATGYGVCSETTTPVQPNTLYGMCKHVVQATAAAAAPGLGFSFAWGRVFSVFGPGEHPDRLTAAVINALLDGRPARCSTGTQIRDYLYSAEVANALCHLIDSSFEGSVNIGSGRAIAVRDLVKQIASLIGRDDLIELGAIPAKPGEPAMLVADVDRLTSEVGWTPQKSNEEALMETIEWWRSSRA